MNTWFDASFWRACAGALAFLSGPVGASAPVVLGSAPSGSTEPALEPAPGPASVGSRVMQSASDEIEWLRETGRLREAGDLARETLNALADLEDPQPSQWDQITWTRMQLGEILAECGELDAASTWLERAIESSGKGRDPELRFGSRFRLTKLLLATDRPERALEVFETLADLLAHEPSLDHFEAWVANGRGEALHALGDDEESRRFHDEAVALCLDSGDLKLLPIAANNLAARCLVLGEEEEALGVFQSALRAATDLGDELTAAVLQNNLAWLHLRAGRLDESASSLAPALDSLDEVGEVQHELEFLDTAFRLALARGELGEAEAHCERALGRLDAWIDAGARFETSTGWRARYGYWPRNWVELQLRRARAHPEGTARREWLLATLDGAWRWKSRGLLDGGLATQRSVDADLKELRARLPKDGVFVDYLRSERGLHAVVIDRERLEWIDLGAWEAVLENVRRVDQRILGTSVEGLLELQATCHALYQQLIEPLGPAFLARSTWVVSPVGELARLPFAMLGRPPSAQAVEASADSSGVASRSWSDFDYVVREHTISRTPSARLWAAAGPQRAFDSADLLDHILVVGVTGAEPYDSDDVASAAIDPDATRGPGGVHVPWARQEALAVALFFHRRDKALQDARAYVEARDTLDAAAEDDRPLDLVAGRMHLLLGAPATHSRLSALASGIGILHIAAHSEADPRSLRGTGIQLAPEGGLRLASPLDIAHWAAAPRLVFLASCSGARGRLRDGEGYMSLARSFLRAGAVDVIATTWSANDSSTSRFVPLFYRTLAEGAAPAEALRQTQLQFLASGVRGKPVRGTSPPPLDSHPLIWAPFVLTSAR